MNRILLSLTILLFSLTAFSQEKKQLTLNDFVSKKTFKAEIVSSVSPMNDGAYFTMLTEDDKIVKYRYATGEEVAVLFDTKMLDEAKINDITSYTFSNDEKRVLLETNKKQIYRRSYTADYFVWDFYTKTLSPVSEKGAQQVATFSPDGERIAFVRDNNIFVKTIKFGSEAQVTTDGKKNEIINGIPDWVYEEEFEYNKAFEWSPDSKMIAFVKFNEKDVPEYSFPEYKGLSPEKTENKLYPGVYTYKYPKAGENNSVVTVHVYDIKTKSIIRMKTGDETDIYIPMIKWSKAGTDLAIARMNRRQNELNMLYANPYTGDTRVFFTEKNSRYIDEDFLKNFTFLDDNEHFTVISERNGWSHLYLYKNSGFIEKQLTSGNFDVTSFYGYDPAKKVYYYQAAKKSPLKREVYSLSADGKKDILLTEKDGTNKVLFNNDFQYYINYYSNSTTPLQVAIKNIKGKEIKTIEDNSALTKKLQGYILPNHEFFTFKTSEGIELNGYMLKPSTFDASKKYPVVMTQYSGPNSQEVTDSWLIDWHYFLAEQGYVVVCVDPRGTAARGEEFRKCTYMQLGKLESDDQIEAAKYLTTLPFVDKSNIAIWGWSHGGFMTALCLEKGGDLFKAGVAVAPVTNWRFYDTVYTERFMRKPQENADGYDDNSPLNHPEGIKSHLLIIHGTADDNVHVQNTLEFTEALVQAGIQFDMHLYTNRNHSIFGGETRMNLYTKIFNYFETNLK
jgi:dipeptidyl-peptidase 4